MITIKQLKKIHFWIGAIGGLFIYFLVYFADKSVGMAVIATILFYIYWEMPSVWCNK